MRASAAKSRGIMGTCARRVLRLSLSRSHRDRDKDAPATTTTTSGVVRACVCVPPDHYFAGAAAWALHGYRQRRHERVLAPLSLSRLFYVCPRSCARRTSRHCKRTADFFLPASSSFPRLSLVLCKLHLEFQPPARILLFL